MKTFEVYYKTEVYLTVTVEAKDKYEARDKADEIVPSELSCYCGNGSCDQLVGVDDERISLCPDGGIYEGDDEPMEISDD
jgi:hypothetical protein